MNKKISLTALLVLASLGITQHAFGFLIEGVNRTEDTIEFRSVYRLCPDHRQELKPGETAKIAPPMVKKPCYLRKVLISQAGKQDGRTAKVERKALSQIQNNIVIVQPDDKSKSNKYEVTVE